MRSSRPRPPANRSLGCLVYSNRVYCKGALVLRLTSEIRAVFGRSNNRKAGWHRNGDLDQPIDMSLSEIIDELPRLSHQERRERCRRVIDLESECGDILLCDHIARQGFAVLGRMEVEQEVGGQSATR